MTLLLQNNANTITRDSDGNTALHRAAAGGHHQIARQLVEHDARLLTLHNGKNESAWDLIAPECRAEFDGIGCVTPSNVS